MILRALIFLAFIFVFEGSAAVAQEQVGNVLRFRGEASVVRAGNTQDYSNAMRLFREDRLQTGGGNSYSFNQLARWPDNLVLRENSSAELVWAPVPGTVYLSRGGLRSVSVNGAGSVPVTTDVALVQPVGTAFFVDVAGDGATTVYVEQGAVRFSNLAGASVVVNEGLFSRIDSDSNPPSPPAPPPPGIAAAATALRTTVAATVSPAQSVPAGTFEALAARRTAVRDLVRSEPAFRSGPRGYGK